MKTKCDKCGKPATIHLTEIIDGQKMEKHLCEGCATTEGITSNVPVSQLLEEYVLQSSSGVELSELRCDVCGISFAEFRQQGLLGCPHDYDAFARVLVPLLERTHEGASQHMGKAPTAARGSQEKQSMLLRLRAQLKDAVGREDYEKAAALRDQIKSLESE